MNYEEEMKKIELQKQQALTQNNNVYGGLVNESNAMYDNLNAQTNEWKNIQENLVNQQTQFTQDQYGKAKDETQKSYLQEAKGSNIDYQKFINPYGAEAEQQKQSGLSNAGVSESIKLGAYNTAQMRTATARASKEKIQADFDTKIQEARMSGNVQLAEIALQQMQMKMDNTMKQFDYKSSMSLNQAQTNQGIDQNYYGRIQDTLTRQAQEKAQQEALRQYQEQFGYQKEQDALAQSNWQKQYNASRSSSGGSSGGSSGLAITDTTTPVVESKTPTTNNQPVDTTKYQATMTPSLSSKKATDFIDKNISQASIKNGGITKAGLSAMLSYGLRYNYINESDMKKIVASYGIK